MFIIQIIALKGAENMRKRNYKLLAVIMLVSLLSSCGESLNSASQSINSNVSLTNTGTSIFAKPVQPDTKAQSFDIDYYHDSEIDNCSDGMVLVTKNSNIDGATKLVISWGDDDKPFDNYNALIEFDNLKTSEFEFNFKKNSLIPMEATKIWAVLMDSNNQILDKGSIGVESYKKDEKKLYEFQVLSDQQISDFSAFYRRSKKAFEDIKENSPDSSLIAVDGDIVDEAVSSYYDKFYQSFDEAYGDSKKPELLVGIGNHEFIRQNENADYQGYTEDQLKQMYEDRLSLWEQKTSHDSPYFYYVRNNSYYVFLGTTEIPHELDGNTRADCTLGETQLNWLSGVLDEASKTNNPIYLFSHGSLRDTVSGSLTSLNQTWYGYTKEEETKLRSIIEKYDNLFFFSGHSHWAFESESPYMVNKDNPSYFNTGAVGYLWEGEGGGHSYNNGNYENGGGQGLYVEVYEDQVHIKGRQFEASDKTSKYWFSNYQVVVPIK